jgi:hypothetical protein
MSTSLALSISLEAVLSLLESPSTAIYIIPFI